jgi:hypothetical protein
MKFFITICTLLIAQAGLAQDFMWSYQGSGCPDKSIIQRKNPTNNENELSFTSLTAYKQGGLTCNLRLQIKGQQNISVALDTMTVFYNYWLSENVIADFYLVSTVDGIRDASQGMVFAGPDFNDGQVNVYDHSPKTWTPCGRDSEITIDINVAIHTPSNDAQRMMLEKITYPKLMTKPCQ